METGVFDDEMVYVMMTMLNNRVSGLQGLCLSSYVF